MVVIDATMLMLLFRPDVPARLTDSKGKQIDHVPDRVAHLVKTLESSKSRIVIPAPVLSELLVRATPEETQRILDEINRAAVFRVEPFEQRAAIELAVMTRSALADGDKKSGSKEPWAKVKFDRQIVAIARVLQVSTIYTDDENLASTAKAVGIDALGLGDLALPPETAQGKLPLEPMRQDAIDEIAQQAKTLQEPPLPEEPPSPGA
jgi:predicted nucleic acid-binding protein